MAKGGARMGSGFAPKPASQTRHKNPLKPGIVVAADAKVDSVPKPPMRLDAGQQTIWAAIWAQPIATLWGDIDLAPLCRMVILQTTRQAFTSAPLLAEMRHLEDRFLLNPTSRAQQRVTVGAPAESGDDVSSVSWIDDARNRLHDSG